MSDTKVRIGLVIGLIPAGLLAGLLLFLNLHPSTESFNGFQRGYFPDKQDSYGWPRTYCNSTTILVNRAEIMDEGGVGNPNAPPQFSTSHDIDSEELAFNIIWSALILVLTWLGSAYVYNSKVNLGLLPQRSAP
jgi:hypothetical protein